MSPSWITVLPRAPVVLPGEDPPEAHRSRPLERSPRGSRPGKARPASPSTRAAASPTKRTRTAPGQDPAPDHDRSVSEARSSPTRKSQTADRCAALPSDGVLLAGVSLLAETAAALDNAEHASPYTRCSNPSVARSPNSGSVAGAVDVHARAFRTVTGLCETGTSPMCWWLIAGSAGAAGAARGAGAGERQSTQDHADQPEHHRDDGPG